MFGGNPQRTGWAKNESSLTKENLKNFKLEWKAKLQSQSKELTALSVPVIVTNIPAPGGFRDIVVVAGSSDKVFALDAENGKIRWEKQLAAEGTPKNTNPNWLCPNALNATPYIDKSSRTVYVLASDGRLHSLNFLNGEDTAPPTRFAPPYAKTWSLTMVDNVLYTATSQGCSGVRSAVYAMDMKDPNRKVSNFVANPAGGAGIWGRAGVAITADGKVVAETGDGSYDTAAGKYSDTFLGLSAKELKLVDYYTPANRAWITKKDLDMGCMSPIVFPWKGKELVAGGGKEGVIYLLDAKQMGGTDHSTPLFRSPLYTNEEVDFASRGFWGAMAYSEDQKGNTWLFAPAWGPQTTVSPKFPNTNGETPNGSIMAFRVEEKDGKPTLTPGWRSRDLGVPEAPIVANGIVFALSSGENTRQVSEAGALYPSKFRADNAIGNATLYAFDAENGKELFSSGKTISSFTHFSGLAISEGRVYVTTFDNTIYAFGLGQ
ncbi:MAG: PQQ-binding-like beta-propeller repeat protein [Bryobacteraceae bacterium]|nr:PQQ-binding-like beta-propeller repeat protein [Bryobacteraceae bacterium]